MGGYTPRGRKENREHWLSLLADPTVNARTTWVDDLNAGHVSAWTHDEKRQIGYVIAKDFWGQGVGTAALAAFLDEEDHRSLWAFVAHDNVRSLRVLDKCGFERADQPAQDTSDAIHVAMRHDAAATRPAEAGRAQQPQRDPDIQELSRSTA
jgi:GNAT superfamily N-acetyltransferase